MALKLKPTDLRIAFAKLRGCIVEGLDTEGICERMGMPWEDVEELRRRFLESEAEVVRHKPTEHVYVEYCLEMRGNMAALDRVVDDYEKDKNVAGYVGAVKARAEMLDRIIKLGQDFGLIERTAEAKGYAAGEAIKGMGNAEFRQYIFKEISVFNSVQLKFGDRGILDVEPGPLYSAETTRKFPIQKTPAHSRNRVFGGRRVSP